MSEKKEKDDGKIFSIQFMNGNFTWEETKNILKSDKEKTITFVFDVATEKYRRIVRARHPKYTLKYWTRKIENLKH